MHSWYFRKDEQGNITQQAFSDIDGARFGATFERGEGVVYTREVALEIVNRWNELAANSGRDFIYFL